VHVIVIGGGIVGVTVAYYLRENGVGVTLLEKSHIGAGNTSRANGGIRAQFSSPVSASLSLESIKVWETFEEEFGIDIGYRQPGYLFLAREKSTAETFQENVRKQNEAGVPSEFLSPGEAKTHCPKLYADRYSGGAYSPTDGFADPHLALQGFLNEASDLGADVRAGIAVQDVVRNSTGRVTGVVTPDGSLEADYVVNATGAWAAEIGEMVGLDLPISPRRRRLVGLSPQLPLPDTVPFVIDADASVHFRPERDGDGIAGGHFAAADPEMDPGAHSATVPFDWSARVAETVAEVARYFGPQTEVKNGWTGLYAVTPDHHPIIEETVPGFVNAVGFSGHGFMQAPATGQIVSEIITEEEARLVDVSMLTADRFNGGSNLTEGTVID